LTPIVGLKYHDPVKNGQGVSMSERTSIGRRQFLKTGAAGVLGAGLFGPARGPLEQETSAQAVPRIKDYRVLGRTGFKVSDVGFGGADLQEPALLQAAIDAGINYVDVAEHYSRGNAERAVGDLLKQGTFDRKSIFITTKLNISRGEQTREIIKDRALKCLERLRTDFIDCLQIHMVPAVDQLKHEGFHAAFRELRAEGKVRFAGISCHGAQYGDVPVSMEDILLAAAEDGRFDVVLFVYNFLQEEQGNRILKACKAKGIGTTLMKANPVIEYRDIAAMVEESKKAGKDIPPQVAKMLDLYKSRVDASEDFKAKYHLKSFEEIRGAAIRFGLSHPDVHSTCPSITNYSDLEAYVALSGTRLEPAEARMLADYRELQGRFYCRHACGLCESSCPHGVPVNTIMRYNHYFVSQHRERRAMQKYAVMEAAKADVCGICAGPCEAACPYGVPVQGLLVGAHHRLTLA
jgi:predicted aldo/keto reductase-like oxidoreductase